MIGPISPNRHSGCLCSSPMARLVHPVFLFVALFFNTVAAQLINGQTFTNGLAIIDSPNPNSPGHAGSPLPIAIDVSGNGKLPPAASLPASNASTGYQSLEIYLVSATTNINITVSAGPGLLANESGSTVKHVNWPIPTCLPAGNYNLTFYESSHFNGQGVFTITPIPVPISNSSPSGQCDGLNSVQAQPQSSNPLTQSPFAPNSTLPVSGSSGATAVGTSPIAILTSCALVLQVLVHRSFLGRTPVFYLIALAVLSRSVAAQILNGQTFTNGLAVIDSPSPNNPGHAGSVSIAIDVSGNGQLPDRARLPGSGLPTSYELLEIYLVSAQTNINMTVSAGPALLASESGSTVKHLNWPIPACIPAGNYNVRTYSRICALK
ncbi:hypothetical protein C8R46DRAFT_206235 [Mycena filopes]|nr:hypothetical protein C8R46DRAFT_206235 [Mycena filopes]